MKILHNSQVVAQLRAVACLINVPHASMRDVEVTRAISSRVEDVIKYMEETGRSRAADTFRRFLTMIQGTMDDFLSRCPSAELFPIEYTFSEARFRNYWDQLSEELRTLETTDT